MDEPVARYFDKQFKVEAAKILPGQYHAAADDIVIVTVLGSCVSACLWDPLRRIGGMNHFMLPGVSRSSDAAPASATLGVYAMEVLINRLLKLGADRGRLQAKVFGGASVLEGMDALNVGTQNGAFVLEFLAEERIPVVAQDLYDVCPRKVYFFPASGKVMGMRLGALRNDTLEQREREYLAKLARGLAGEVEIFGRR
jgi:chemotaxis protein CheD